jgi:HTH-type transcriptional regulator/antitoxin HigA
MTFETTDDNKEYEKLTKRFPLRPIRDDAQNERAAEICDMLTSRNSPLNQAESDYLEVLTDLIAKYESKWESDVAHFSSRELIQYLMVENDLSQKDLIPEFGSASRVCEFLKGERNLSIEQAKRLAKRFSLNIAALVSDN